MATPVAPMLATPGPLPASDAGWAYEFKWDGVRAVVAVDAGGVTVTSRNARDVTASYPELEPLAAALAPRSAVLDGEIVAFGPAGHPDFGRLQARMHVADPARARRLAAETPVALLLFDLLALDGRPTVDLSYRERRSLLEELGLEGPNWATPPSFRGDGRAVLDAAARQHLEGVLAKRLDSPYRPGARPGTWVKVKLTAMQEVVVGGFTTGQGRRRGIPGALLLGVPDGGRLGYVGKVGTGFTDAALRDLAGRFAGLLRPTSPFDPPVPAALAAGATWVEPVLVGEVGFGNWTADGRLRHPTWRGLRPDKTPSEVVREPPPGARGGGG